MLEFVRSRLKRLLLQRRHTGLVLGSRSEVSGSSFGANVRIGADATIISSSFGDHSYIGPRATVVHAAVGRYCSMASDIQIGSGSHPSRGYVSSHPIFYLARPSIGWSFVDQDRFTEFGTTSIGNDVWIGAKATVRDGVSIGDGAIIGAGAVVVKDVAPYSIVGGVPAKLLRMRFAEADIAFLLELRWWDCGEDWLREHAVYFDDVARLREVLAQQAAGA